MGMIVCACVLLSNLKKWSEGRHTHAELRILLPTALHVANSRRKVPGEGGQSQPEGKYTVSLHLLSPTSRCPLRVSCTLLRPRRTERCRVGGEGRCNAVRSSSAGCAHDTRHVRDKTVPVWLFDCARHAVYCPCWHRRYRLLFVVVSLEQK